MNSRSLDLFAFLKIGEVSLSHIYVCVHINNIHTHIGMHRVIDQYLLEVPKPRSPQTHLLASHA